MDGVWRTWQLWTYRSRRDWLTRQKQKARRTSSPRASNCLAVCYCLGFWVLPKQPDRCRGDLGGPGTTTRATTARSGNHDDGRFYSVRAGECQAVTERLGQPTWRWRSLLKQWSFNRLRLPGCGAMLVFGRSVPTTAPPRDDPEPDWKQRYLRLKARLAEAICTRPDANRPRHGGRARSRAAREALDRGGAAALARARAAAAGSGGGAAARTRGSPSTHAARCSGRRARGAVCRALARRTWPSGTPRPRPAPTTSRSRGCPGGCLRDDRRAGRLAERVAHR